MLLSRDASSRRSMAQTKLSLLISVLLISGVLELLENCYSSSILEEKSLLFLQIKLNRLDKMHDIIVNSSVNMAI
jgi:hypothetical protein